MAKKESFVQKAAREGGENEVRASEDYNRMVRKEAKTTSKPAKRAVGRKLKK